jgi:hypothetical protein
VLGAGDPVAGTITAGMGVDVFVCKGTRLLDRMVSGKEVVGVDRVTTFVVCGVEVLVIKRVIVVVAEAATVVY